MKKVIGLVLLLVVITVGLVVAFGGNDDNLQGRFSLQPGNGDKILEVQDKGVFNDVAGLRPVDFGVGCSDQWQEVFEGEFKFGNAADFERHVYGLDVLNPLSFEDLSSLIRQGCDFKMVQEGDSGAGPYQSSLECELAATYRGVEFGCNGPRVSPGLVDQMYYSGSGLLFEDGEVFYAPPENYPSPTMDHNVVTTYRLFARR